MNLFHLRYFTALAHIGHYGKTAEKLCIAQPSLSHAMGQLQAELGITLFEKRGRSSLLTKEGAEFLNYVEKSLAILDEGIEAMERASRGEGRIAIGFLRTLGISFIPELTAAFLKENPDKKIRFSFHSGITGPLLDALKAEKLDVVFCTKFDHETEIEFTPVAKQDLVLIVPRDHPLAVKHSISLAEALPYPQVYFSQGSGLRTVVDALFEKIGGHPEIAYEIEEDQVIAGLVAKNFGIAVVPYMEELLRLDVKILQISYPYWERNFYMAVLKNRHRSKALQTFIDHVKNCSVL